jgi:hypothetical protein
MRSILYGHEAVGESVVGSVDAISQEEFFGNLSRNGYRVETLANETSGR